MQYYGKLWVARDALDCIGTSAASAIPSRQGNTAGGTLGISDSDAVSMLIP